MNRIRDDWVRSRLGDVIAPSKDKADPKEFPDEPYVGLEHVEAHTMRLLGHGRGADVESTKSTFRRGDVLYGKLRPYLNKVVQPDFDGICSTDFLVFRESKHLDPAYLAQYLNQTRIADAATQGSRGVQLPRVNWQFLANLAVSFPPDKSEQRAIARLLLNIRRRQADTRQHLVAAQRALHKFRQSVIAAACTGRLTADWRDEHPTTGEVPAVEGARSRLNEHTQLEVPDPWRLTPMGAVLSSLKYGTSRRADYSRSGIPVLRIPNVSSGKLDLADLKRAPLSVKEEQQLALVDGDLLMVRSNGSPALLGVTVEVTEEARGMAYAGYLIRLRVDQGQIDPTFLALILASAPLRRQIEMPARSTSGVHNINTTEISRLGIPVPPPEEQHEIVRRVTQLMQVADALDRRIAASSQLVDQGANALLMQVFGGHDIYPTEAFVGNRADS